MGYYYTTSPENAVPPNSWASPKTHVPGSPVKERGYRYYSAELGRWVSLGVSQISSARKALRDIGSLYGFRSILEKSSREDDWNGSWMCGLDSPIDATGIIANKNPSPCMKPCTQKHEEQHESDYIYCCRKARKAYQAAGADKDKIEKQYDEYMDKIRPFGECKAYQVSVDCAAGIIDGDKCKCPSKPENSDCCSAGEKYKDGVTKQRDKFCGEIKGKSPLPCPF
jgi:hypothetical protein